MHNERENQNNQKIKVLKIVLEETNVLMYLSYEFAKLAKLPRLFKIRTTEQEFENNLIYVVDVAK